MSIDLKSLRQEFPALFTQVNGQDLVYLDNAATSLKPKAVAERLSHYYQFEAANIHRGAHTLSRQGTENYEKVRLQAAELIGAKEANDLVFTRGVTESINLLSYTLSAGGYLKPGDVILLSPFEHHSNTIPWRILADRMGCRVEILPFDENGKIRDEDLEKSLGPQVKVVSLLLYSNVTGVRLDVEKVIRQCRQQKIITIIDAAQAMIHEALDVQKMDCDFLTFSAHKMLGPFGVGVLYGKSPWLSQLPPFQGGGSMVSLVTANKVVYQDAPHKFEAGTPSVGDVIAFGAAMDFISQFKLKDWVQHGRALTGFVETELEKFSRVQLLSPKTQDCQKTDIVSFNYEGAHASDVGELLDQMGIAVRAGHHCAQPLMEKWGVAGTVRVSLAPYNSEEDVQKFLVGMKKVESLL